MRKPFKLRYPILMDQQFILRLLKHGVYTVDSETTQVFGRTGKEITQFQDHKGYSFVRLYFGGRRKAIAVNRLVWMSMTKRPIPAQFEIHHDDGDHRNNKWDNLICLHKLDHQKKHSLEEAPF